MHGGDEKAKIGGKLSDSDITAVQQFPVTFPKNAITSSACYIIFGSSLWRDISTEFSSQKTRINFPKFFTDTTKKGNMLFTNSTNFKTTEIEVYSVTIK